MCSRIDPVAFTAVHQGVVYHRMRSNKGLLFALLLFALLFFMVRAGLLRVAPNEPAATRVAEQLPPAPGTSSGNLSLTVVGWNVESGGNDPNEIAARLAAFDGVDIWGLSEVKGPETAAIYEIGIETGEDADFVAVISASGGGDQLAIFYDSDRFEELAVDELERIALGGRAPLYVHLRDRNSGVQFLFMVNHLLRGSEARRQDQARLLNDWAQDQALPVLALGDYNFDWDLQDGDQDHDAGYDLLTEDGVFVWVRPERLVTTQCSSWPCRYNSVLDFVFVAGPARDWHAMSEIVVTQGDFPDTDQTSDHRPVLARFSSNTPLPTPQPSLAMCDPAYPDFCIPSPPPRLSCTSVTGRNFTVFAPDPHGFDGNGDGIGCEQ